MSTLTIKQGYKQTDIGIIPEDWEVRTFKEVSWVNQGLQIAIEQRHSHPSIKSKKYITIQSLGNNIVEYINEYSPSVCCDIRDILMTRTGNTGIVVTGVKGVFHNNFFKVNYNDKLLNREYLLSFLRNPKTKKLILEKAGTSTIPDLNHKDFYSIQIPLPPLPEQIAIAAVLSDIDQLITSLTTLIAKKKQIKIGTMQKLLKPQSDWEVRKLGEIGKTYGGLTGKSKLDFVNCNSKYIPFMNIMSNTVLDLNYLDSVNINQGENQNQAIKGDLFFNKS